MESKDANTRSAGTVSHPSAEEWMTYLYRETSPERTRKMRDHLKGCAACGQQLDRWRRDLAALDEWELPVLRKPKPRTQPVILLRWAVAAAVMLCLGFAVGRMDSSNARELAELKASVAQLAEQNSTEATTPLLATNLVTREDLIQLLADYSKLNEQQRAEERRVVGLALREMDLRLDRLRTELETVAVNTESGFQQTKDGLTTLAAYTIPNRGINDLNDTETKN